MKGRWQHADVQERALEGCSVLSCADMRSEKIPSLIFHLPLTVVEIVLETLVQTFSYKEREQLKYVIPFLHLKLTKYIDISIMINFSLVYYEVSH